MLQRRGGRVARTGADGKTTWSTSWWTAIARMDGEATPRSPTSGGRSTSTGWRIWARAPRARSRPVVCAGVTVSASPSPTVGHGARPSSGPCGLGAVAVPLPADGDPDHVAAALADCAHARVVADGERPARRAGDRRRRARVRGRTAPSPVEPGDLAYLVYSSGSTGRPKAAMHAHADLRVGIETYAARSSASDPATDATRRHASTRRSASATASSASSGAGRPPCSTAVHRARGPHSRSWPATA